VWRVGGLGAHSGRSGGQRAAGARGGGQWAQAASGSEALGRPPALPVSLVGDPVPRSRLGWLPPIYRRCLRETAYEQFDA